VQGGWDEECDIALPKESRRDGIVRRSRPGGRRKHPNQSQEQPRVDFHPGHPFCIIIIMLCPLANLAALRQRIRTGEEALRKATECTLKSSKSNNLFFTDF
jgi:hypothetical protein